MKKRQFAVLRRVAIIAGLLVLAVVWFVQPAVAQRPGGTLRVALLGEPPSIDPHFATATVIGIIAGHYLEGLFTRDKSQQIVPMLAEGYSVSSDGKVYTIRLRRGVTFHNGKEMTSEDVTASLDRWLRIGLYGKALAKNVERVQATDKYVVEIRLKGRSAVLLPSLAFEGNVAAIMPKEVVEAAGDKPIMSYIGTGPFRVVEWKPDQYIKMIRYDRYAARSEPPSGYGGKKTAYVDTLLWLPTPDAASRLAALEAGDVDFIFDTNADAYPRLQNNPKIRTEITRTYFWLMMTLNKKKGLFSDETPAGKKLRQAVLAAIDQEPIARSAVGRSEFYRLDGSIAFKEEKGWWVDVPRTVYDQRSPEKAKRLLQEAGYKGQPIRYMTTQEYDWMYKFSIIAKQQLEDVGMKVDLQVMDWASVVKYRLEPDKWDACTTGIGPYGDPTMTTAVACAPQGGWVCNPEIDKLLDMMRTEPAYEKRYSSWKEIHRIFYEDVLNIRHPDIFGLNAMRKEVKGTTGVNPPFFWNVWLDQ